jgi:hypothetical protein
MDNRIVVSAEQTGNGDGTFRPATSITAGKGAKRSFLWGLNVPSPLPRNMVAPFVTEAGVPRRAKYLPEHADLDNPSRGHVLPVLVPFPLMNHSPLIYADRKTFCPPAVKKN